MHILICGTCGDALPPGAAFCPRCGSANPMVVGDVMLGNSNCQLGFPLQPCDLVLFDESPQTTLRQVCNTVKAARMIQEQGAILEAWVRTRRNDRGVVVEMEAVDEGIIFDRAVWVAAKLHTY